MKFKIIVVEDEPLIRLALAGLLQDEGYEVLEAGTADEALVAFVEHPDVALLLTDYDMPGSMNGADLSRRTLADHPSVGIIVVSGAISGTKLALPSTVQFIGKPYQEGEVLGMIDTLLAPARAQRLSGTKNADAS